MTTYPEDWERIPFGDCFELHRTNTCSRALMTDIGGGIQNIHYGDILVNYGAVLHPDFCDIPFLTEEGRLKAPTDYLNDGDVVIADTAEDEATGKVVEVCGIGERKIVAGLHTVMCRPLPGRFASGWLGYWMNSPSYHNQLLPLMTGIKVLSLSKGSLLKTFVLAPPLPEQRRIAAVLGNVDKLIDNLAKRIEKKRLVKQGVMQDLLTGKKRLPGFEGEWGTVGLSDVAELASMTVLVRDIDPDWYVGTENMLPERGGLVRSEVELSCASVRAYRSGDVLLSNIRPYLKKIWLADRCGGSSNDVLVVRGSAERIYSQYLYFVLSQDRFFDYVMDNAVGTKMPRGDKKVVMAYRFSLPIVAEQRAIASVLSNMDAEIAKLEAKREKYLKIKQGLMNDLLTGKVRV